MKQASGLKIHYMWLDPRRLSLLLAVHRYGGVLAAADELNVTASAVSQQMAKLETEVGITLLDRRPHGAVLTPAGRVLIETAERIEAELTDARRALAVQQGAITGTVTIGAFQSILQAVLIPLVAELSQRMPGVRLVLKDVLADDGMRQLRSGAIDVLMLEADNPSSSTAPRGTHDVVILDEPWLVAVPAAGPIPATLDDLCNHTWLGVDPTAAAHAATERVLAMFTPKPLILHSISNSDVAISMVAGGLGVALLPSLVLVGALRKQGVQAARLTGLGSRRVVARHRTSRAEPRREVTRVLEQVQAACDALDLTSSAR